MNMIPEQEKVIKNVAIKVLSALFLVVLLILLVVLSQSISTKENESAFRAGGDTPNVATPEIPADQVEEQSVQTDSEAASLAESAESIDAINKNTPEVLETVSPTRTPTNVPPPKKIMTLHENFGFKYQDESKTALVSADYEPRSLDEPCVEVHAAKSGGIIRISEVTDGGVPERLRDPEAYADFKAGRGPGKIVPGRPVSYSYKMYIDGHPFSLWFDQPGSDCGMAYYYEAYKDNTELSILVYIPYEWGFDENRGIDELVTVN